MTPQTAPRNVILYIEGGAPGTKKETTEALRRGFAAFFAKCLARQPKIIMSGNTNKTLKAFASACRKYHDDPATIVLCLVDADAPVTTDVLTHLRTQHHWAAPAPITDAQCHLMVQCMESWFLADPAALARVYRGARYTPTTTIEAVGDPVAELQRATARKYKKPQADKLLARLSPATVRQQSPYCERLLTHLESHLQQKAS